MLTLVLTLPTFAEWEMLHELSATYAVYITKEGVMLHSDFQDDRTGGIYISEDKGLTWKKTNAKDYNYSGFYEYGDYVYAVGYSARIARSEDGGRTWDVLNYSRALENIKGANASGIAGTACYGLALHNGKLYACDFAFGVVMSEDWGESWSLVDLGGLTYKIDDGGKGDGTAIETLYNIFDYNGTLMTCGLYHCYVLNDNTNRWTLKRNDSNCMAVHTVFDGTLYCGRSMPNWDADYPFLLSTLNMIAWKKVAHPTGVLDTNVRALFSDNEYIYAGLQRGGVFVTADKGMHWYDISYNLPHIELPDGKSEDFLSPLRFASDDEYLYLAIYNEPWNESQHTSGVYRISKSELHTVTGIDAPSVVSSSATGTLYDLSGRCIAPTKAQRGLYIQNGKTLIK